MSRVFVVLVILALLLGVACGSGTTPAAAPESAPPEETPVEAESEEPTYDYTPIASAKKGDLIELPEYPFVAVFTSSLDVRGMKTLVVKVVYEDDGLGPRFVPSVLNGSPGQKITLTGFKSEDAPAPHTFTIDATGINMQWGNGKKPKPVTVTFPKKGVLGFWCKYHIPTTTGAYMGGLLKTKA